MFEIYCPHCNSELDTSDYFEHWRHAVEEFKVNCESCSKELTIKAIVSVDYDVIE
ncbi:hypothetical protein HYQ09_gp086 [Acinetobacter phage vB_AbaM_Konradin]|uniref:Uncharacterized protein n=1 Tax=Acinetobacter phage vB_AbaM_Konradin TaxID=2666257 RepID=A0A650EV25_9CAUD|nr:hypothetical protein HYQ09_gp086 [Acinetobacter phage vB_AbaM_Konradin]QGT53850.1 hypothetical protein Konradin_087 [Acinetobacter phage vB_AbaM_Konradin]